MGGGMGAEGRRGRGEIGVKSVRAHHQNAFSPLPPRSLAPPYVLS